MIGSIILTYLLLGLLLSVMVATGIIEPSSSKPTALQRVVGLCVLPYVLLLVFFEEGPTAVRLEFTAAWSCIVKGRYLGD